MRTRVLVGSLATALFLSSSALATQQQVLLCHVPPGDPEEAHEITVRQRVVHVHLEHGDLLGECPAPLFCEGPSGTRRCVGLCPPGLTCGVHPIVASRCLCQEP
jgi:hypothetical protein